MLLITRYYLLFCYIIRCCLLNPKQVLVVLPKMFNSICKSLWLLYIWQEYFQNILLDNQNYLIWCERLRLSIISTRCGPKNKRMNGIHSHDYPLHGDHYHITRIDNETNDYVQNVIKMYKRLQRIQCAKSAWQW